jgi:hypothetical protein
MLARIRGAEFIYCDLVDEQELDSRADPTSSEFATRHNAGLVIIKSVFRWKEFILFSNTH